MAKYKISAWDINSNELITECTGAFKRSFGVRLNDAGPFSFNMPLEHAAPLRTDYRELPFKVIVSTNNDQTILYSGIKWTEQITSGVPYIKYGGKALISYFDDTFIAKDYIGSFQPAPLIQTAINDVQNAEPGYNRGIAVKVVGLNQPAAFQAQYAKIQYPSVAQILSDVTSMNAPGVGGVDYYMQDVYLGNKPRHTLVVQSPRCGRDQHESGLVIDLDKGAVKWDWPSECLSAGNHVVVVGSGSGNTQPIGTSDSPYARGGRGQLPRLDVAEQYSHIANQAQLQAISTGLAQQLGKPIGTPVVTVPATYPGCTLGTYIIGDDVRLRSGPNLWFPNGLDQWWRIVDYQVNLPDEGQPTVDLTLNPPPII